MMSTDEHWADSTKGTNGPNGTISISWLGREEDALDLVERQLDGPLADPIKALEVQYQLGLSGLVEFFLGYETHSEPSERGKRLVRRVARHFLFDYYLGFMFARFSGPYSKRSMPTNRQRALEEALSKLALLPSAREVMVEYSFAALEGRLHRLLRDYLSSGKRNLDPRYAAIRTAARLGLSDDWEIIGRLSTDIFQIEPFGMSVLYLAFKSTGKAASSELEALLSYAARSIKTGEWPRAIMAMRLLCVASLLPEQQDAALTWTLSVLDPSRVPSFTSRDRPARFGDFINALGFSKPTRAYLKLVDRLTKSSRDDDIPRKRWSAEQVIAEDVQTRREVTSKLLRILAIQSTSALGELQQENLTGPDVEVLLPEGMRQVSILKMVIESPIEYKLQSGPRWEVRRERNGETQIEVAKILADVEIPLEYDSLMYLIQLVQGEGKNTAMATAILEHAPGFTDQAERMLVDVLASEANPQLIRALVRMQLNLHKRDRKTSEGVQEALFGHLLQYMFDVNVGTVADASVRPGARVRTAGDTETLRWLFTVGKTAIEKVLDHISKQSKGKMMPGSFERMLGVLAGLAQCAGAESSSDSVWSSFFRDADHQDEQLELDAATFAACWLVDPSDLLEDRRPTKDRIVEALRLLRASDKADWAQKRIAEIIDKVIDVATSSSRVSACKMLARALRTMKNSGLALPLLEHLMDAVATASTGDRHKANDYSKVYAATLLSVAAISPLTEHAVRLLEKGILGSKSDSPLYSEITSAFVEDKLLPLLTHEVLRERDPDKTVPLLVELLWKHHCDLCGQDKSIATLAKLPRTWRFEEAIHQFLHMYSHEGSYPGGLMLQCCLQALANVRDLLPQQQRVVWRIYRTSWNSHIKGLCLLILGRQQTIRKSIMDEILFVLQKAPVREQINRGAKFGVRNLLFRTMVGMKPPDPDLQDIFPCQTVAVNIVGGWLRQKKDDMLVRRYGRDLEKALLSVASLHRFIFEPFLTEYVSLGSRSGGTQGMLRLMGASSEEIEQQRGSWISRPADRAYAVLLELIKQNSLPSIQARKNKKSTQERKKR